MHLEILLTELPIERPQMWEAAMDAETGSFVEFYGSVRKTEGQDEIASLHYEAYESMVEKVIREKIALLEKKYPCQALRIVHRLGQVSVGESAIYVGVRSRHRREGFLLLQGLMDEFKRDVPIWKRVS